MPGQELDHRPARYLPKAYVTRFSARRRRRRRKPNWLINCHVVYLGTSRSSTSPFNEIISDVAAICSRVDRLIARSSYLNSPQGKASLTKRLEVLHSIGPFFYLTSGCAGGIWEQCIRNFVSAFQETKVQVHEYLLCVETLKRHAAKLDRCIPELEAEIRKFTKPILPTVLGNAECMRATLRGLINTASQSFDLYCHKPNDQARGPLRHPEDQSLSLLTSRTATATTIGSSLWSATATTMTSVNRHPTAETHIYEPTTPNTSPARFFLLSYPTLQAVTILVCLIATTLQLRAYALTTTSTSSSSPTSQAGTLDSSDFYSNLQSTLMQSLTTYTGLVPAIRVRALRGLISVLWVSLLSVTGLVLNFAALGIYFHDAGMAPLLSFFGNVAQAITVLHLAIRIENFVEGERPAKGEEEDEEKGDA